MPQSLSASSARGGLWKLRGVKTHFDQNSRLDPAGRLSSPGSSSPTPLLTDRIHRGGAATRDRSCLRLVPWAPDRGSGRRH